LPVSRAAEPVAGESADGGPLADEHAPAVLTADQALGLEDFDGLAGGHPSHAVGLGERGLAGQQGTLRVLPVPDGVPELVGDLPVGRAVA
jgi:hypothetical protein